MNFLKHTLFKTIPIDNYKYYNLKLRPKLNLFNSNLIYSDELNLKKTEQVFIF